MCFLGRDRQLRCSQVNKSSLEELGKYLFLWTFFDSYLPDDFHRYYKSERFLSVQNKEKLLQIEAYYFKSGRLLQIGPNITNRWTKHVYSGRAIFNEIEDHNYEFLNKIFLQYREGQLPWASLLFEVLEAATRIGIHRRCFLRDNLLGTSSSPKASRNCLLWSHFLIKTQDQV